MIVRGTEERLTLCQDTARDLAARFYPGLRISVELADLPLSTLGFACRGFEARLDCQIVLDKTFVLLCSNADYLEGIHDLILHEENHARLISRGANVRHISGQHGNAFAKEANRVSILAGFPYRVRSSRNWGRKKKRHILNCRHWPMNQRADISRYNKILRARRALLLRPVSGEHATAWAAPDAETILEALHSLVEFINEIYPQPKREQLARIVAARRAVEQVAGHLADCGLLPRVPVSTWEVTPKPPAPTDQTQGEIENLIRAVENGY